MKIGRIDWRAAAIVSALVLQVFFFSPLQVFLNNTFEFSVQLSHLFPVFLIVAVGLIALPYLLARHWSRVILPLVTFLSVVAFLESKVFLGLARHRPFDGQLIDWRQFRTLSAVELATAATVGVLVFVFRRRREMWYSVSLFILLFHVLGLGYTFFSRPNALGQSRANVQGESYFNDFYRLSKERNIIHIVPDQTQGAMVYDVFQSDLEHYSQVFDGFTLFTQAMGRYPSTYPSVLFYMTGLSPDPGHDFSASQSFSWDYVRNNLKEHSIVTTLANNGFKTFGFQFGTVYCVDPYSACAVGGVFDGLPIETSPTRAAVLQLQDVALFQTTPVMVRKYIYNDGEWFLKGLRSKGRTYSGVMDVFLSRMTTDERPGSYNYLHMAGGHAPLQFGERCNYIGTQEHSYENQRRQVACTMLQIERLIEALKRLGVYDQTMIIVNGDHGTPGLPSSVVSATGNVISADLVGTASTLVLVKPMNARGPLKFSTAPVATGDIPATINDALALNGSFPGVSVFQVADESDRERQYYLYDETTMVSGLQSLPNLRRYRIRGNLFDENDWIRPVLSDIGETPFALGMDHENFRSYAIGFGGLEIQSKPVRWVIGTHARVYLSFPTQGKARLVLESYVPRSISGQSVEISINEQVIGRLDDKELAARMRHVILVPDSVPRKKVNTIELKMGKAVRLEGDRRNLSTLVAYVGLEPAE